ncbi:hypothetical protein NEMBOFW57_006062 [Staphylotrichum longicolle]|uniref:Uncharacterized protein n=1 Tax=Staphylotrichum longicolle TaxID=669026 RepID=A0AAD4EYC1_9PEZI|nr:hypothetical protein NEMBOFW57_006062 [Staphylotrichum longicolle]
MPAPVSSVDSTHAANKRPSKPSVAPFFQRIESAFQDKPTSTTKPSNTTTATLKPARYPSPDAEDLIQQLKEHYLQTATTLHTRATLRLTQTHADLARELAQSLTARDEAFLARAEAQIKTLAQPLDKFRIRAQRQRQRGADDDNGSAPHSEENSVGELVARAEAQVRRFEEEVRRLWAEWAAAEGEVKELVRGVVACVSGVGGDGEGEGREMLRRFREEVDREIGEAEEEVGELGEEAVALMKEIEKDFRKATLPDLHTFFRSIDEP